MSSKWNHNICEECWFEQHPTRKPIRMEHEPDLCCFCGASNVDGIYVRHDPETLLCKGEHHNE
jgi:hypothetical protein